MIRQRFFPPIWRSCEGTRWRLLVSLAVSLSSYQSAAAVARASSGEDGPQQVVGPRDQMILLSAAIDAGDDSTIRASLIAETASEAAWVEAICELSVAAADYRRALAGRFGHEQLGDHSNGVGGIPVTNWETAVEEVRGPVATIKLENYSVELRKVDGRWCIPVLQLIDQSFDLGELIGVMNSQSLGIRVTADELRSGKYNTAQEAGQMLRKHILQQIVPRKLPAPPPTTLPSKPNQ